ncbi:F-BAR domain only protein 1 isoform X2 [Chroicocephalus ridibundus]|uniref:F-BAR domain only protein 1 isoform X2 n=1 Tax=Chroicocephalus ridibundus TaxID=1192867 RepID=UPI002FDEB3E1
MSYFTEHFWGEKNHGFDVLYHNMKHGQISTKELADFVRERAAIEENYAKAMVKLSKMATNGTQLGTFAPLWEVFRISSDKLALCHLELMKKLHDLIKEISRYGEEQGRVHKKSKEEVSGTLEAVQLLHGVAQLLPKSKESYHSKCQEYERLRKEGTSQKEIDKAELKSKKAGEALRRAVEKYNAARADFEQRMLDSAARFQEVEEAHLRHMKGLIGSYSHSVEDTHVQIGQVHEEFKQNVENIGTEMLLRRFAESKGTGRERPGVLDFDEYRLAPTLEGPKRSRSKAFRIPGLSRKERDRDAVESPDAEVGCPEVDEDGFTVRPDIAHTEAENHVCPSSDSDYDEDEPRKFYVHIKPVQPREAAGSAEATMEQLKATVGNLILPPSFGGTVKRQSSRHVASLTPASSDADPEGTLAAGDGAGRGCPAAQVNSGPGKAPPDAVPPAALFGPPLESAFEAEDFPERGGFGIGLALAPRARTLPRLQTLDPAAGDAAEPPPQAGWPAGPPRTATAAACYPGPRCLGAAAPQPRRPPPRAPRLRRLQRPRGRGAVGGRGDGAPGTQPLPQRPRAPRSPLARPFRGAPAMGQTPQPQWGPAPAAPSFLQLGLLLLLLPGPPKRGGVLQPLSVDLPRVGDEADRGRHDGGSPAAARAGCSPCPAQCGPPGGPAGGPPSPLPHEEAGGQPGCGQQHRPVALAEPLALLELRPLALGARQPGRAGLLRRLPASTRAVAGSQPRGAGLTGRAPRGHRLHRVRPRVLQGARCRQLPGEGDGGAHHVLPCWHRPRLQRQHGPPRAQLPPAQRRSHRAVPAQRRAALQRPVPERPQHQGLLAEHGSADRAPAETSGAEPGRLLLQRGAAQVPVLAAGPRLGAAAALRALGLLAGRHAGQRGVRLQRRRPGPARAPRQRPRPAARRRARGQPAPAARGQLEPGGEEAALEAAGRPRCPGAGRLWPALGQLGAPLRSQQAQPRGSPVQQRGQHAVGRRRGAGERRVPHVAGQEEVCYRDLPGGVLSHLPPDPPSPPGLPPWLCELETLAGGWPGRGCCRVGTPSSSSSSSSSPSGPPAPWLSPCRLLLPGGRSPPPSPVL